MIAMQLSKKDFTRVLVLSGPVLGIIWTNIIIIGIKKFESFGWGGTSVLFATMILSTVSGVIFVYWFFAIMKRFRRAEDYVAEYLISRIDEWLSERDPNELGADLYLALGKFRAKVVQELELYMNTKELVVGETCDLNNSDRRVPFQTGGRVNKFDIFSFVSALIHYGCDDLELNKKSDMIADLYVGMIHLTPDNSVGFIPFEVKAEEEQSSESPTISLFALVKRIYSNSKTKPNTLEAASLLRDMIIGRVVSPELIREATRKLIPMPETKEVINPR
jgi:phosphate/sulfate permease